MYIFVLVLKTEKTDTCNRPNCQHYPMHKKSLEGIAWRNSLERLLKLKINNKTAIFKKYFDNLYAYARISEIRFNAQITYIEECDWCTICEHLYCDADDCPRTVKTVSYTEIEHFYKNPVVNLLNKLKDINVINLQFTSSTYRQC